MTALHSSNSEPFPGDDGAGASAVDASLVEDLLRALSTAHRSYRLYGAEGAMLQRFVDALEQKLGALWNHLPELRLRVEEQRIRWEGRPVFPTGSETGDLAFLFFKDGIRELVFLPGFEKEVGAFLRVLNLAPQLRQEEDDLVTLLWQEDLASLRYEYVEPALEGVELPTGRAEEVKSVSAAAVRADASATTPLTADDFQETLYFLDESDLRRLMDEVQRELDRDLWRDVINALYDRLEDGRPERQLRIMRLLAELLPSMLAGGEFGRAADMLQELVELASRPGLFSPAVLRELRDMFGRLSDPETVQQLAQTLEDHPQALQSEALSRLLAFFPPGALAPLMRVIQTVGRPDVRRALEQAVERLAVDNRDAIVQLLDDADSGLVAVALRWVARLEIGAAVSPVTRLLRHPDVAVRLAAIEALQALRAAVSGPALLELLEDDERDVRIAAVKAMGALEYSAARPALEEALGSKRLRAADRTEKIAFFEAYGRLGGVDAVPLLDRTLNGKSWLGRGESAEIRACAALGLARVRHPSAKTSLNTAANDSDPVVRSAVARALRGEGA